MSDTLVLMLGDAPRWLRISGDEIVARGDGFVAGAPDDHVVGVVPARDVTIHHAELPNLSEPQAKAAARLLISEQSAALAGTLHVALGQVNSSGDRPVVAIDHGQMVLALADMAAQGFDPDSVIAAPMLLARPDTGFVKGDFGTEVILRGHDSAFVDDPTLTPLLTQGNVTTLDRSMLESGLVAAIADPEVDLRQGIFAKRRAWGLDWVRLRRIGWLALAIGIATLLFQIVQLVRLNMASDRIEANNIVIARAALPPGVNINNPLIQVQEQLNSLRGPGGGMLPLAAGVASAVNAVPNMELTSMIFDGGGTLRVTARATTPTDLTTFEAKLAEAGLVSAMGPVLIDQGRQVRDYTVSVK